MRAVCLATFLVTVVSLPAAQADAPVLPGVRPLGMGGALRAAATGDAALVLNPSGMSAVRTYVIEGAYMYTSPGAEHDAHVSIVDSTSAFNISGGLYYTYLSAQPGTDVSRSGHEGGVALSLPIGQKVFIGGTGKYFRLDTDTPAGSSQLKGITFDAGLTLRPIPMFSMGLVAYNLRNLRDPRAPQAFGAGVGISTPGGVLVTLDGVYDLTSWDDTRGNVVHLMGGAEYVLGNSFALRVGGGRRGDSKHGFVSGGISFLSDAGAIDAGFQQDVSGDNKATILGIAARLFIPAI